MLDKNGIIKRLIIADKKAKNQIDTLKGLAHPTLLDYQFYIRQFILAKFLLDDEDVSTDELNILAKQSVGKANRINPDEDILLDAVSHCGSATSAITKKVLMLVALQEVFDIDFQEVDTPAIKTTAELAEIIMNLRERRD